MSEAPLYPFQAEAQSNMDATSALEAQLATLISEHSEETCFAPNNKLLTIPSKEWGAYWSVGVLDP